MSSEFEEFCGGPFWNSSLTWGDAKWPEFTHCFQHTLLLWLPCLFLWVTLPLYFYYMATHQSTPIRRSRLTDTKMALSAILAALCVVEMILVSGSGDFYSGSIPDTMYVTPTIQAATMILTMGLLYVEIKHGFITSGVQSIFWLLLLVCNVVPFYTRIFYIQDTISHYDATVGAMVVFYVQLLCILIQFLLQFKVEVLPSSTDDQSLEPPCPEILASFFSRLSFWWITSMVVKGYKKALDENDLWDLNPRDKCATNMPVFQKAWEKEVDLAKTDTYKPVEEKMLPRIILNKRKNDDKTLLLAEGKHQYGTLKQPHTQRNKQASLFKVVILTYGPTLLKGVMIKAVYDVMLFVSPQILRLLIEFTENKEIQQWKGYIYIVVLFACSLLQSVLYHQNYHVSMTTALRMKTVLIAAVYRKSLAMNSEARQSSTVGEIVNLMSVDSQRILDFVGYIWMLISIPIQIILCMVFLYQSLGPSTFAGLGVMLLLGTINAMIAVFMRKLQVKQMQLKDQRIKLMNEILNGIKVIKLNAWETLFQQKINVIRTKEVTVLRQLAYMSAFSLVMWTLAPYLVTLVTFVSYILTSESHRLDATQAFVSLSLFNILRLPIMFMPMIISYTIQAYVAITRIGRFLQSGELDRDNVTHNVNAENALSIKNGTFSWDKNKAPVLCNINVEVGEGKLVAVVGTVGAGKSSLISAFLGEMEKLSGQVNIKGSVAYVPQQAWIQHATLRDNILFGSDYDDERYNRVIESCALKPDLAVLTDGDQTEIGERGINLSGGQKQRVSLARAVYNDADIYLLDDPLSAVDSNVGRHLFKEIIGNTGLLKHKTRILVTHGLHWLPKVDTIVILNEGKISDMGSFEELMHQDGAFSKFVYTYLTIDMELEEDDAEIKQVKAEMLERAGHILEVQYKTQDGDADKPKRKFKIVDDIELERSLRKSITLTREQKKDVKVEKRKKKMSLVQEERAETGQVSYRVYGAYAKAIGIISSIVLLVTFTVYNIAQALANTWLSEWTEDPILVNITVTDSQLISQLNDYYIGVYGFCGVVQAIFVLIFICLLSVSQVEASAKLHNLMLDNMFRNPMLFFDTTPTGRIMNRFSRDVETIDNNLPRTLFPLLTTLFNVLSTVIVISATTPLFTVVLIPLIGVFYIIQRFYIATSRQLKRVESTSRSPIYAHFTETIMGASSIRAYNVQDRFKLELDNRVDHNQTFFFAAMSSYRWVGIQLEFLGNLLIVAAALFTVIGRDSLTGGLVGLSVSYALQMTRFLTWTVRMTSDLETNVVSVERVIEFSETPTEAAWEIEETKPGRDWPESGRIEFIDYSMRYRPGLDTVLKGVNFTIKAGEKVGIVGRTGAGKSSLSLALFRMIEAAGGMIVIDNKVAADMGLHDLRARLTILPQDPVLFSGSLRMNLDPQDSYTDSQLWQALDTANLKTFVWPLPQRLNHEVGDGGSNLSVGQRQLVCLARSLLKKTSILVLDEATAVVDIETDDLIQHAIRSEFSDCTVVTIAHRLNTIMDYDRVMVLDQGLVKEFDTPDNLLSDNTTIFYNMAKGAGIVH